MARTTKSDTAQNFGKNDEVLKEFAKGEDVGHGVDHDCPACRTNRSALKKAGLHASDIKGLEGGSPPVGGTSEGQPPQAATAFIPPAPGQDIILGPGSNAAPDVDGLKKITERIIGFGHNEIAAICRDMLTKAGIDPNGKDQLIYDFAAGYNGERTDEAVRAVFSFQIDPDHDPKVGQPMEERSPLPLAADVASRHVRLLTLSNSLGEALATAMTHRGFPAAVVEFADDVDLGDAIVEGGGRFMLMNGFIPDDRNWHCEIGFGGERAAVAYPNKGIAIMLCALIALDPKAGAPLNSQFMQLMQEEKPQTSTQHWVGTGAQP